MFYDEKNWQDFVCYIFIESITDREFDLEIKTSKLTFKLKEN